MARLHSTLMELYITTETQATQIRELERMVHDLGEGKTFDKTFSHCEQLFQEGIFIICLETVLFADSRVLQIPWKGKKEPQLPPPDEPRESPSGSPTPPNALVTSHQTPTILIAEAISADVEESRSLVLDAIKTLQRDLWNRDEEERNLGVVSLALNHFYQDVYRVPLSV